MLKRCHIIYTYLSETCFDDYEMFKIILARHLHFGKVSKKQTQQKPNQKKNQEKQEQSKRSKKTPSKQ